jgi:hypothetical protein
VKRLALAFLLLGFAGGADAARRSGRFGYHHRCAFMIGDGFMVSASDGSPYDAKTRFLARLREPKPAAAPPARRRARHPWFSHG